MTLLESAGCSEASDDLNAVTGRSHAGVACELLQLTRRDPRRLDSEVSVGVGAERLEDVDLGLEGVAGRWKRHQARVREVLRADADDHIAAARALAPLRGAAPLRAKEPG